MSSSAFGVFVENCCSFSAEKMVRKADLWSAYQRWVAARGLQVRASQRDVAAYFSAAGIRAVRPSRSAPWCWGGVVLRDDAGVEELARAFQAPASLKLPDEVVPQEAFALGLGTYLRRVRAGRVVLVADSHGHPFCRLSPL